MPSGVTRFTAGALAACGALAAVEVARLVGVEVPQTAFQVLATVTAVLAATAAIRNVVHVRRGPLIVSFHRGEGLLCDARESGAVRAAAQLRGTLGGAGYLFPRRLAFTALAWAAAAAQAVALIPPWHGAASHSPFLVALLASAAAARFPAIPFYYREAAGNCVVVFPAEAAARLLANAHLELAPSPVALEPLEPGAELAPRDGLADERPSPRRDEPTV